MLEAYRQHVADRAAQNIPPAPLSPEQVADLVAVSSRECLVQLLRKAHTPAPTPVLRHAVQEISYRIFSIFLFAIC